MYIIKRLQYVYNSIHAKINYCISNYYRHVLITPLYLHTEDYRLLYYFEYLISTLLWVLSGIRPTLLKWLTASQAVKQNLVPKIWGKHNQLQLLPYYHVIETFKSHQQKSIIALDRTTKNYVFISLGTSTVAPGNFCLSHWKLAG